MDLAVSDFQIELTLWIGADPSLIVHSGSLGAEIRQRHQTAYVTRHTFRPVI